MSSLKSIRYYICVLVAFYVIPSFAQKVDPLKDVPSIQKRMVQFNDNCIKEVAWTSVTCNFPKESEYHSEWYDSLAKGLLTLKDLVDAGIFETTKYCSAPLPGVMSIENILKKNYLDVVDEELKKIAQKSKLNECQKACLAKCASANLISYVDNTNFKSLKPEDILYRGYGLCQHFAHLANHFNDQLGLSSRWEGSTSMGHEFNRVKIDGVWYYEEPQSDRCDFLPSPQRSI